MSSRNTGFQTANTCLCCLLLLFAIFLPALAANAAEENLEKGFAKPLGVLWTSPWRVEITDVAKPSGSELEIDVVNLWANRVIGDLNLPREKRFTQTHDAFRFDMLTNSTPLIESGLLGPVNLLRESKE
jgi:hypothetical protein